MTTTTTTNSPDRSTALEHLSALVDGELEGGLIGHACLSWRGDGDLRSSWHAYHLIGDVLRSDDLASDPARDAGFMQSLRARLADEPVVLAPARATAPSSAAAGGGAVGALVARRRRSWMASSAVAAGFVAVAGVVFMTRTSDTPGRLATSEPATAAPMVAAQASREGPATAVSGANVATGTVAAPDSATAFADSRASVASGKLIRDVRLDR